MVFRESPMTHDKDVQSKTCLPAAAGAHAPIDGVGVVL
jgi:hypothetical protein